MSLIYEGAIFPPANHIERIAKYHRMKAYFDGKHKDVYNRMAELLINSPQQKQLNKLYIAINLPYILCLKPADLLIGDRPTYDSGFPDDSVEQKKLNEFVEENDLNTLIYESATGGAYRGESFLIARYGTRQDLSELDRLGLSKNAPFEAIIEHAAADSVFPETSEGNIKKIKAYNVTSIESVMIDDEETLYLNVAKHIPGFIVYEKYRMKEHGIDTSNGFPVTLYKLVQKVKTSRGNNVVETGTTLPLVFHVPYSSVDDTWQGKGFVETVEHALQALEDRITQLDYILLKHSDPVLYGPELQSGQDGAVQMSGKYIPLRKEDATPGAITWDGKLEAVFKEIDYLISYIFQMSETPQWLFGTTISGGGNSGGTGTSHSDGAAIKARFMPILSKVKRIRNNYDKTIRDILWTCFELEKAQGNYEGKDVYPKIYWKDGIPKNELEEAQIMEIRTGSKPTIDLQSAIKRMDELDDMQASEIISRIKDDEASLQPVDPNTFNLER